RSSTNRPSVAPSAQADRTSTVPWIAAVASQASRGASRSGVSRKIESAATAAVLSRALGAGRGLLRDQRLQALELLRIDLLLLEQVGDEGRRVAEEEPARQLADHRPADVLLAHLGAVEELPAGGLVRDDALLLHLREHRRDRRQRALLVVGAEDLVDARDAGLALLPEDAHDRVLKIGELVRARHGWSPGCWSTTEVVVAPVPVAVFLVPYAIVADGRSCVN